jgi:hypothetical protein
MLSSSFSSEVPKEDEEIKCPKCLSFFDSLTKPIFFLVIIIYV